MYFLRQYELYSALWVYVSESNVFLFGGGYTSLTTYTVLLATQSRDLDNNTFFTLLDIWQFI